jgi:transposase, IS30 family
MVQSKKSGKRGLSALPLTEKREEYARLMRPGMNKSERARLSVSVGKRAVIGVTGTYMDAAGRRLRYPPVIGQLPPVISARFLSDDERVAISDGLHQGQSLRSIAARLGRSPSTVSREVRRNTPPAALRYLPHVAHKQSAARRRRPGRGEIAAK